MSFDFENVYYDRTSLLEKNQVYHQRYKCKTHKLFNYLQLKWKVFTKVIKMPSWACVERYCGLI
jgi:hypothetical protein